MLTYPSFGAVLETFEVADGIANIVASKDGTPAAAGSTVYPQQAIMA